MLSLSIDIAEVIRRARPLGICSGLGAALLLVSACSGTRESVVATTRTETVQAIPPPPAPKMVDISIVNLHDEPAADPHTERLVGTIVNDGDRAVSKLSVRVDALDDSGNVRNSVTTPPLAQTIDPFGGRATFETSMPRDRAVTTYHAVALAR
jgi:hypothetical protein